MRLLLPLCLALALPTAADAQPEPITCYDVAVLGTLRNTDDGYRVSVSKTYVGGRVPNRIPVFMNTEYGAVPSIPYHRDAVFYLTRLKGGYFGVLSTAGREPLDGRGLLTRARVDDLAVKRGLSRCAAER